MLPASLPDTRSCLRTPRLVLTPRRLRLAGADNKLKVDDKPSTVRCAALRAFDTSFLLLLCVWRHQRRGWHSARPAADCAALQVPGIGPAMESKLEKLGINTVRDAAVCSALRNSVRAASVPRVAPGAAGWPSNGLFHDQEP